MSKHWTDNNIHLTPDNKYWVGYDEAGLEHIKHEDKEVVKESLILHSSFTLNAGPEAYKLPSILGQILKRIVELRLNYFISADGTVLTYWKGGWAPYHEVAEVDTQLVVW